MKYIINTIKKRLYRCPICRYYSFNGQECYDCGYIIKK